MRDDIPAAALRLACSLPVRTHMARELAPRKPGPQRSRAPREVIVGGIRFASVNEAARKLHRADRTIRRWLLDGTAAKMKLAEAQNGAAGGRGGQNRKRIIVNGREYSSIGKARKALHCCIHAIYDMLADGRARYVSEADQRMVNLGRTHRSYRRA